ncbi:MAG: hypothetical protein RMI34_03060 [Chloroherpetonaceae bacterium]|nr:hypothetical protein [Chloroherpetonaceae bacterium]MCS7212521.1 hypothetical protein [Chloroherpetonaceae bacterium]MDW8019037.1 hypothetical protein [Chloroherpetonaceae bacterium]MDW8466106.1 hypothetical protein [Chloroherpetonaceae bacterium]
MLEKIEFRKRREVGDLISVSLEFIQQNFKTLALSLLYVGLPLSVLQGTITALYQSRVMDTQDATSVLDLFATVFGPEFFLSLLLSMVLYAGVSATAYSFVQRYISQPDPSLIQVSEVLNDTLSNTLTILVTALLLGFLLGMVAIPSLFLLFIPVLYLGVATAPLIFIRLYEQKGFFEAFLRSFQLVQGNWWRVFATLFVLVLVGYLISLIFSVPGFVIGLIVGFNSSSPNFSDYTLFNAIFSSLSTLGFVVLNGLLSIGIAFVYFDLVERKESSGLMQRIEQMSTPN